MSEQRDNFIKDLVSDLTPVRDTGRVGAGTAAWLLIAAAYSVTALGATGPWREGALAALASSPLFAAETLIAAAVVVALARATLRCAIPGLDMTRALTWLGVLFGVWIGIYVVGLWYPAHPVSMLGKRDHCAWQTILFSLPSFALMVGVARRYFPLRPRLTGFLAGAGAAAIPGMLMQFACMYVPSHILTHHIGPVIVVAIIGMSLGRLSLLGRRTVPRRRSESVH